VRKGKTTVMISSQYSQGFLAARAPVTSLPLSNCIRP